MLHNILLKADKFTEIAKQGKYINVVLAAGEITARIRKSNQSMFETKLVSGMSLEINEGFESVALSAKTAQQTKVWIGEIPLTYTSIDSRVVGASALQSSVVKCFSGQPRELLPAQAGRGKVTLYPRQDINIGGTTLSSANAIKIPANTKYELSTQGAIFAFDDSGNYQPMVTAGLTPQEILNPIYTQIGDGTTNNQLIAVTNNAQELIIAYSGWGKAYRYSAVDFSLLGEINLPAKPVGYFAETSGNKMHFTTSASWGSYWVTIDLDNLILTQVELSTGDLKAEFFDVHDDNRFTVRKTSLDTQARTFLKLKSESVFTEKSIIALNENISGVAISQNNTLFVAFTNQIATSIDEGATWSIKALPATTNKNHSIALDKSNGYLYFVANDNKLRRSVDDGSTWEILRDQYLNVQSVVAKAGTVVVIDKYSTDIYTEANGWVEHTHTLDNVILTAAISTNGYIIKGASSNAYIYKGVEILGGGIDVAVLAEVN